MAKKHDKSPGANSGAKHGPMSRSGLNELFAAGKAPRKQFRSTFENINTPEARIVQEASKMTRKGKGVSVGRFRFK
jgi:hypothetical protein